jgi:hypothetical protein
MIIRLVLDLFGIAIIAFFTQKLLTKKDEQEIYDKAINQ